MKLLQLHGLPKTVCPANVCYLRCALVREGGRGQAAVELVLQPKHCDNRESANIRRDTTFVNTTSFYARLSNKTPCAAPLKYKRRAGPEPFNSSG
jgi:hypothetical protein